MSLLHRAERNAVLGVIVYIILDVLLNAAMQPIYTTPFVDWIPTHWLDARQYPLICIQGYELPGQSNIHAPFGVILTTNRTRFSWMPVYALLQCGLHRALRVSMVYAGSVISALALGGTLFFCTLTLAQLGIGDPALYANAAFIAPIGGAFLYAAGAEAIFLFVSMLIMWLITLPESESAKGELYRSIAGIGIGLVAALTKPNALFLVPALAFAFLYLSWRRSQAIGYASGFYPFVADLVIAQLKSFFPFQTSEPLSPRPIRYAWSPLTTAAGIVLGIMLWNAYASVFSGIPFYFFYLQRDLWPAPWSPFDIRSMILYFAQAFRGVTLATPWRISDAWALAAVLSGFLGAVSSRVPTLIRGMISIMIISYLLAGTIIGIDRYVLSTGLCVIGLACWLAPKENHWRASLARWTLILCLCFTTSYLLIWQMMPRGLPNVVQIADGQ